MPKKIRLVDLNEHLFEQLERLNNDDLDAEGIQRETARTRAICEVAGQVVDLGRLSLAAARIEMDHGSALPPSRDPLQLGSGSEDA